MKSQIVAQCVSHKVSVVTSSVVGVIYTLNFLFTIFTLSAMTITILYLFEMYNANHNQRLFVVASESTDFCAKLILGNKCSKLSSLSDVLYVFIRACDSS